MSMTSDRQAGFTLLEIVVALALFAFIVVEVLADREKSIGMSADARIIQTVRYLAMSKIDEIRHDPEALGEGDQGDFSDLNDDGQDFSNFLWEAKVERVVAVGVSEEDDPYLFEEDDGAEPPLDSEGKPLPPRYVRRLTLVVTFEPAGQARPDLSLAVTTYLPPAPEDEEQGR